MLFSKILSCNAVNSCCCSSLHLEKCIFLHMISSTQMHFEYLETCVRMQEAQSNRNWIETFIMLTHLFHGDKTIFLRVFFSSLYYQLFPHLNIILMQLYIFTSVFSYFKRSYYTFKFEDFTLFHCTCMTYDSTYSLRTNVLYLPARRREKKNTEKH